MIEARWKALQTPEGLEGREGVALAFPLERPRLFFIVDRAVRARFMLHRWDGGGGW